MLIKCLSYLSKAGKSKAKPINHVFNKDFYVLCFISCMLRGLQKEEIVLLTHGDSVDKVADGFKVVARSGNIVAGKNLKTCRFHF